MVSWLHLSDIHILRPTDTPGAEAYNQKHVLDRFVDFMAKQFPSNLIARPRYLFITGDLAFTGKKKDYEGENAERHSVRKMIDAVAGAISIAPNEYGERVFPVLGNHDIDRDTLLGKYEEEANLKIAANLDELNDLFLNDAKESKRNQILARSRAYCDFVRTLWGNSSLTDEQILWYSRTVPIEGSSQKLHVVGLNSAWLCHSYWVAHMKSTAQEKEGEPTSHLTMCEALVDKRFERVPSNALTVALMHHDYEITRDRNSGIQHLLESKCDFILCGHEHTERWATPTLGRAHKIRSGSFYERRGRRNAVNIVEVDIEAKRAKMLTIHYRPDKGGFWAVDKDDPTGGQAGYTCDSTSGILSFYLNRPGEPPTRTLSAAPAKSGLNAQWRELLLQSKSSVIEVTSRVYGANEQDFWHLLDQTSFDRRSDIAGNNFRQRLNSLLNLCIFRVEYSVVRSILEALVADCRGVDVFQIVLDTMESSGQDK